MNFTNCVHNLWRAYVFISFKIDKKWKIFIEFKSDQVTSVFKPSVEKKAYEGISKVQK